MEDEEDYSVWQADPEDYVDIDVVPTIDTIESIKAFLLEKWPNAIVSDSIGSRNPFMNISPTLLYTSGEFCVYKDYDALQLWDGLGCVEDTKDTAIVFELNDDYILITYDSSLESSKEFMSGLKAVILK